MIIVPAVVALLLLGAAAGALLRGALQAPPPPTPNAADIGFMQDMIYHHQQAITMAQTVRDRSDPQIAGLAYVVESNQLQEIGQMRGYLDLWGQSSLGSGQPMAWMGHDDGAMSTMTGIMPGMATQDEMNRFQEMSGSELGTTFLQLMIRHHQGALPMAETAARLAAVPQTQAFAQQIAFEQSEEIQRMAAFLAQRGGKLLPAQ